MKKVIIKLNGKTVFKGTLLRPEKVIEDDEETEEEEEETVEEERPPPPPQKIDRKRKAEFHPEPIHEHHTETEPKAEPKTELKAEPKAEPKAESKTEPKTEVSENEEEDQPEEEEEEEEGDLRQEEANRRRHLLQQRKDDEAKEKILQKLLTHTKQTREHKRKAAVAAAKEEKEKAIPTYILFHSRVHPPSAAQINGSITQSVSFPFHCPLPSALRPYPAPLFHPASNRLQCSLPGCSKLKTFTDAKSKQPFCSYACLRKAFPPTTQSTPNLSSSHHFSSQSSPIVPFTTPCSHILPVR